MSGSSVLNQNIPFPTVPIFDVQSGVMSESWYRFFLSLFARTGGPNGTAGVPGGINGNVQFNNGGVFGGLTNIQLTARIQHFSDVLSGAATASGGGTTNFLRADGSWTAPSLGGAAGGDLSGTYPNPAVAKINSVALGTTTATAGNILVGSGTQWVTKAVSGDAALASSGAVTVQQVNGVAYPASPATGTVPFVTGANAVTYEPTTGTGDVVLATNPTLAGATVDGNGALHMTSQVTGAGAGAGTLTNAPKAGNPDFWVPVMVNGTAGWVPWWHA